MQDRSKPVSRKPVFNGGFLKSHLTSGRLPNKQYIFHFGKAGFVHPSFL